MLIRDLTPDEAPLVARFYTEAPDYWRLAEGACEPERQSREFFSDAPPGCDPADSRYLGLFLDDRLSGVAELSFGFPEPDDAYLGLMLLGPWAQGAGKGAAFLTEVERLARTRNARHLYLAVLEANPRGRAFWEREGFSATGLGGTDPDTGHVLHRLVKAL
ncbi:MAG: GNAT family N-acetyltransferase [Rhodobacterales bacterium]|nr:GNAT family N-acetyltransferase [Rhodobacterales bacterium]